MPEQVSLSGLALARGSRQSHETARVFHHHIVLILLPERVVLEESSRDRSGPLLLR